MSPLPVRRSSGRTAAAAALALALVACGADRPHRRAHRPPLVPAAIGRPVVDWMRAGGGERIVVGERGVATGPPAGPLAPAAFRSAEEADDLRFFAGTFAPFVDAAAGERLVFAGRGTAAAAPAERRMIREWTRQEAAGGSGGGVYGLAFAWRGGPLACLGVSVFLSGEVRAGACDWRQDVRGHLAAEPLARLYRWFDAYRPFQVDSLDAGRAALVASGLIFAGRGPAPAPPSERAAMGDLAAALHLELAARRAAALPPPADVQPAKSLAPAAKSPAPPQEPPPPGPSLLRSDLPPPAPATTPILPLAPPAPPSAALPLTADQAVQGTAPALTPPRPEKPKRPPVQQEEDEAPLQGTVATDENAPG